MPKKKPAGRSKPKNSSVKTRKPRAISKQAPIRSNPSIPKPVSRSVITEGVGFGRRVLARLLDSVYGGFLGLFGGFFLGIVLFILEHKGLIDAGWNEKVKHFKFSSLFLDIIGVFLYHSFTEGFSGASIGKMICGIRVVTVEGEPCGLAQAFKRSFAFLWDSFFFGLVAYQGMERSRLKQRYGDSWAETVVIKDQDYPELTRRPGWSIMVGLILGSLSWELMLILGLLLKALS